MKILQAVILSFLKNDMDSYHDMCVLSISIRCMYTLTFHLSLLFLIHGIELELGFLCLFFFNHFFAFCKPMVQNWEVLNHGSFWFMGFRDNWTVLKRKASTAWISCQKYWFIFEPVLVHGSFFGSSEINCIYRLYIYYKAYHTLLFVYKNVYFILKINFFKKKKRIKINLNQWTSLQNHGSGSKWKFGAMAHP